MDALRLTVAALLLSALPAAGGGVPVTAAERAEAFATCAGTYAGEAEHMRLFDGAHAAELESRRAGFAALTEAVAPHLGPVGAPEGGPTAAELRALRVQARLAQRALLSDAAFHPDPGRRARAAAAATRRRDACNRLLLGA
jgi:hypothetical protein